MSEDKYVVYGAGYTFNHKNGIRIYDMDPDTGRMSEKTEVEITNASYICFSKNRKYLYSITDDGVAAFRIKRDGNLEFLDLVDINGMRGCHISTDYEDRFIFVAGYHDGKVTVLSLNEDGSCGRICDEIYHKSMGSVADRNFRPHVDCALMTPDNKYLCVTDVGMDHIKVYRLDHETGRLKLADIVRSEMESAPHHLRFSKDGRFIYVICELKNYINVYTYVDHDGDPDFEKIQTISTIDDDTNIVTAAYAIRLTEDNSLLFASNAGDESVAVFRRDSETGLLTRLFVLPVSGRFPKDIAVTPDNQFLLSMNNESNTISTFRIDTNKRTLIMCAPPVQFDSGNCLKIFKLDSDNAVP